jgi:hypothetical protein
MDISFIVILGLPVLYVTGSLKKIVKNAGIGGAAFVLYFAITAALSFIPAAELIQGICVNPAGAFFCIAPAVYLAIKKRYTYIYYLAVVITTLFAVAVSFFTNTYTLPYLSYIVVLVIAAAAVVCFKTNAPLFAPVMMGVYGVAGRFMELFGGMNDSVTLFTGIGTISLCAAVCLFASYLFTRPRGAHSAQLQT